MSSDRSLRPREIYDPIMSKALLATLVSASLLLAGCSGAPSEPVEVSTMDELHEYVVDAGANCDDYEDRGEAPLISGSALRACNDDFVLATFPSHDLTTYWSDGIASFGRDLLVGGTWAISADVDTLEVLQQSLGGTIQEGEEQ